ncbi:phosphoketolase [Variovorax paradoxus]
MALQSPSAHPHGLQDAAFDSIFTTDRPVIFAFHGHPWSIHRLLYKRTNHENFHVHGYQEEGTTTTPFDMTVPNRPGRFHLAADAIDRVVRIRDRAGHVHPHDRLLEHRAYVTQHGIDMPDVVGWRFRS